MIDHLVRQLGEHLQQRADRQAFLLIDPLLREPFPKDWEPAATADKWQVPIRRSALEQDQWPRLIQLEARNVALLEASVLAAVQEQQAPQQEIESGFCIGGWLLVDKAISGASLAGHLARCMSLSASAQHRAAVLRFHDRRVLEWMWPKLGDAQRAVVLGPVLDWTYLDRRGCLRTYRASADVIATNPLRLDEAQLRHAQLGELAQDLTRGWQAFAETLPENYVQQISSVVAAVSAVGLGSRQEEALLGAYILQLHPRLTLHPRIRSALDEVLAGRVTLTQAFERIPDPQGWDDIREDLIRLREPVTFKHDKDASHG